VIQFVNFRGNRTVSDPAPERRHRRGSVAPKPGSAPNAFTDQGGCRGVFRDWGDPITLRADQQDGDLAIEVTTVDHRPGLHSTYRDVEASVEGGRGLAIVHALSHGYSIVRQDNERVTTCRVATSE